MKTAVVILAAGKGTRMKSNKPKVLHEVAGVPMLFHIIEAVESLTPNEIIVVTGHGGETVNEAIAANYENVKCVTQEEQLGTGHAVAQAQTALKGFDGNIVILYGDVPLISVDTLSQLNLSHQSQENDITVMTAFADDPTGLGRIVRDANDDISAIVEQKNATDAQKKIDEINTGIYVVKAPLVFDLINNVSADSITAEYYLTSIVALGLNAGHTVGTYTAEDAEALSGINSRLQLACAEDHFQNIKREAFMAEGVTMTDPQSVFFSLDTKIGKDVEIGPNVQFGPNVRVESDVRIEGQCTMSDTYINSGANILSFCHFEDAEIGEDATVGPFCRLRPNAQLEKGSKAGSFVEIKKSVVGEGSKVPHLTYVGDVQIGKGVNIGGGTIFANYDSVAKVKSQTVIADGASIGAGNVIIAPVAIGEESCTGANATITKDVPAGALSFSKPEAIIKKGYTAKHKADK